MKLVELLARELDVWPDGVVSYFQWGNGEIFATSKSVPTEYGHGMWMVSGSHIEMAYDAPLYDTAHELATDHATAIITRADWQAERERIAGGWVAWGGGECPVAEGVRVDVQYRCAKEDMNSGALETIGCQSQNWLDENHRYDIIAYRLHKPEQASVEAIDVGIAAADAGKVKPIAEVKSMYEYNPIHTRDRILEIDRTTEALEEERVQLVQRLADEGFVLARVDGKVAPVEDMSDWRNWREGDMLEFLQDDFGETENRKGAVLPIVELECDGYDGELPAQVKGGWPYIHAVRWHSRPTA